MKRTFVTCPIHDGCVAIEGDGELEHRPADSDAQAVIGDFRGTLAEAHETQRKLLSEQRKIKDRIATLDEEARWAAERARAAEETLKGTISRYRKMEAEIQARRKEVEAAARDAFRESTADAISRLQELRGDVRRSRADVVKDVEGVVGSTRAQITASVVTAEAAANRLIATAEETMLSRYREMGAQIRVAREQVKAEADAYEDDAQDVTRRLGELAEDMRREAEATVGHVKRTIAEAKAEIAEEASEAKLASRNAVESARAGLRQIASDRTHVQRGLDALVREIGKQVG